MQKIHETTIVKEQQSKDTNSTPEALQGLSGVSLYANVRICARFASSFLSWNLSLGNQFPIASLVKPK